MTQNTHTYRVTLVTVVEQLVEFQAESFAEAALAATQGVRGRPYKIIDQQITGDVANLVDVDLTETSNLLSRLKEQAREQVQEPTAPESVVPPVVPPTLASPVGYQPVPPTEEFEVEDWSEADEEEREWEDKWNSDEDPDGDDEYEDDGDVVVYNAVPAPVAQGPQGGGYNAVPGPVVAVATVIPPTRSQGYQAVPGPAPVAPRAQEAYRPFPA